MDELLLRKELNKSAKYGYDFITEKRLFEKLHGEDLANKLFNKVADILDGQGIQGPGENN